MDISQIAAMLRSILTEIDGGAPSPSPNQAPPGFVYVSPTGPQGAGKSRLWPLPHQEQGETLLGYAGRCMSVMDGNGKFYYQPGRYGPILQGAVSNVANMAEALDRITYANDWATQAELDQQARLAERDAGAPWISNPPADSSVPIEGQ
jgi:hypothetical protein